MNEALKQQFEEQLTYLPAVNQQALRSFDWATQLLSIGHQYGLHIDQLEDLQIETMLVLVGLVSPDDYETELITRLAVSTSEAEKILNEVNKQIFIPIHDYIVNGGEKKVNTTPAGTMESAGFQMTDDETPITITGTVPVRIGGNQPTGQSIPDTKPAMVSPLQFHPNPNVSTAPELPKMEIPVPLPVPSPIQLSKEKLEKMIEDRKKTVDATIQSMDQVK